MTNCRFTIIGCCQAQILEEKLLLVSGCKIYYQSRFHKGFLERHEISENFYASFDELTGNTQCYIKRSMPYPKEEFCTEAAVKKCNQGRVTIESPYIGVRSCNRVIPAISENATEVGLIYSRDVKLESRNFVRVCFSMELISYVGDSACPKEIKDYKIDTRNFFFRKSDDGSMKYKPFFKSPSIAQYERLVAMNSPAVAVMDDYNYDDHMNNYE